MMPEYKLVRLFAVLSSVLVLSGCSALNFLNLDAVDDNINYQKSIGSVKALAIPPGLSDPGFNDTYASVQTRSGSASGRVNSVSASDSAVSRPVSTSIASVSNQPSQSSGRSSLGAALLEQSGSAVVQEQKTATTTAARVETASSAARTQQASKPAPVTASRGAGNNPQVAMMRLNSGEPALAVNAAFARTWSSLPPALSAVGFKISKKQPDQGIYTAQYQGQATANLQPGKTYLILVAENASRQSFIGVANDNGKPAPDPVANEALTRLKAFFER